MLYPRSGRVGLNALGAKTDRPITETTCLALDLEKPPIAFQHQVIPLVHTEGKENPMTPPDKLGKDRTLRALTDVDGMVGRIGLGQRRAHARNVDNTSDAICLRCAS